MSLRPQQTSESPADLKVTPQPSIESGDPVLKDLINTDDNTKSDNSPDSKGIPMGVVSHKDTSELDANSNESPSTFGSPGPDSSAQPSVPTTDWSLIPFPEWPPVDLDSSVPEKKKWAVKGPWATCTTFKVPNVPLDTDPANLRYPGPRREFAVLSKEAQREKGEVNDDLLQGISGIPLGPGPLTKLPDAFRELSLDIWLNVLDFIDSPRDLLMLSCSSKVLHELCLPRLYSSIKIRMPFYPGDASCRLGFVFDKDMIPMNLLMHGFPHPVFRRRYSQHLQHIRCLEIAKWHAPSFKPGGPGLSFQTLSPHVMMYDLRQAWILNRGSGLCLGAKEGGQKVVDISVDLALLLLSMPNLRSFRFTPNKQYSKVIRLPRGAINNVLAAGHMPGRENDSPTLSEPLLEALKVHPTLRELTIDFNNCDPLLYERCGLYTVGLTAYNPKTDGLVGFTRLRTLDLRGIGCEPTNDRRFPEIARVIADCIESGFLQTFSLTIEQWWWYYIMDTRLNSAVGLRDWCQDLWNRCFGLAQKNRTKAGSWMPALGLDVTIDMLDISWRFNTNIDYTLRWENLVELRITSGHILRHATKHLRQLSETPLPNLRVVFLRSFLVCTDAFLKSFSGLRELYIINPGPDGRYRAAMRGHYRLRDAAYKEARHQPPPGVQYLMDTIVKCHLRTLEVLVIDQHIPIPSHHLGLNRLSYWKERGTKLRELGLLLWGPWERFEEFLTCFPSLKCFHLFNPPNVQGGLKPIPDAPMSVQLTDFDAFLYTSYFCDVANTALKIARIWAKDVLEVDMDERKIDHQAIRWIAVGPWWIRQDFDWKWKFDADKAKHIYDWNRPTFYGTHPSAPRASMGLPGTPWKDCSKMWRQLEPLTIRTI
ncbi:hypothetical protein FN846DRAFT_904153 [Sphaerosporella brunnea]|uniref:F-box domain-containing protein n=1 Tax=Sphaerosporella brunnea TaxID=1250544 RepID=A0A5J5F5M9_9PEZI|nr:hypothetical protein FN846DRAFT_904153 [Sphaerosporella brunnea]